MDSLNPSLTSLREEDKESTFREFLGTFRTFLPKEELNIWQWADKYRFLAKGVSAKSLEGDEPYRSSSAPHQRKPQESVLDPRVQLTVYVMASQIGGKTEMFNNILGYHMDHCPRNAVVMYPQLDSAEKFSKHKFTPMIEATPCLRDLVNPSRSRDSGNTILVKEFAGGLVYFVGANSAPSLRGTSGGVLLGDEIDSNVVNPEGDSVELLFKRGESFQNAVKVLASTPTVKGVSAIWEWFENSDQQYWFVPCPKCGVYQTLKWSQIVWPKDQPELAELICSGCAAALNDEQRLAMYFAGEWRATTAFNGIAGFHLNGINCPWPAQKGFANRLHQMASDFLRANKKGEYAKQVWVNTFLVECWEVETERIEPKLLIEGTEDYRPDALPDEVIVIESTVDVQKDRLECEVVGIGQDEETWGVEKVKFQGDTEQDTVWEELAEHLRGKYIRRDGIELPITATAIDMRHRGHKVRKFIQKSGIPRVFAVYGRGGAPTANPLLVTSRFHHRYGIRTHSINTKLAKDVIFARLRMDEPGPRYCHFPIGQGYDEEYFLQLTAEVLRRKREKGVVIEYYEKIRDRNESLDLRVYFVALQDVFKLNIGAIKRNLRPPDGKEPNKPKDYVLDKPKEEKPLPDPTARPPKSFISRPKGGFVGRWRR